MDDDKKQIPPLRCGMTSKRAETKAKANTGILRCAQDGDLFTDSDEEARGKKQRYRQGKNTGTGKGTDKAKARAQATGEANARSPRRGLR